MTTALSQDPDTVHPNTSEEELVQAMFRSKRKVVLVTENGKVIGVVHRLDVAKRVLG